MHDVFHASKLEKWQGPVDTVLFPVARNSKQFVVEKVTDVAFNSNSTGLLFKVKWLGYPADDSPWQPYRNLRDNAQLKVFLQSPEWLQFSSSADYQAFARRFAGSPRLPHAVETSARKGGRV